MMVMESRTTQNKALTLLTDTSTCRIINKDPTTILRNKLYWHIQRHKKNRRTQWSNLQESVPNQCCPPKFYGLSKIHKVGTPIRPIMSSRGSITYGVAKELANINTTLKTLNISYSTYKRQDWNQVRSWHHMLRPSSHQFLWTLPCK